MTSNFSGKFSEVASPWRTLTVFVFVKSVRVFWLEGARAVVR